MITNIGNLLLDIKWRSVLYFCIAVAMFFGSTEVVDILKDSFHVPQLWLGYIDGVSKLAALLTAWSLRSPLYTPIGTGKPNQPDLGSVTPRVDGAPKP